MKQLDKLIKVVLILTASLFSSMAQSDAGYVTAYHPSGRVFYESTPQEQQRMTAISFTSSDSDRVVYKIKSTETGLFGVEFLYNDNVTEIEGLTNMNLQSGIEWNAFSYYSSWYSSYSAYVHLVKGVEYVLVVNMKSVVQQEVSAVGLHFKKVLR